MTPLTADVVALQNSVVTLDVLHTEVMWGWFVTMNMWAKSVATGVLLVGVYMMARFAANRGFYRLWMPLLGFVFIALTLIFTVLDLHQLLRFWHMFVWPHPTSALNVGAWLLSAYAALLAVLLFAVWKRKEPLYDRLLVPTVVLAFFATIYTAALMGQASAREIWSTPTETAQMLLAAGVAGSAAFLLFRKPAAEEKLALGWLLALCAVVALTLFLAEIVFAPQKSEEAEFVVHTLLSGGLGTLFYLGLLVGFVVPATLGFVSARRKQPFGLRVAAVAGLVGLWMVKHAWNLAPQYLPLS